MLKLFYKNSQIVKGFVVIFSIVFLLTMQAVSAKEVLVEVPGQGEEALVEVPGEEEESPLSAEEGTFTRLKNPLEGTVDSIPGFVETLLRIALMIGVPIVALAIIYSGFLFVAAQGNPKKLEEARATFMYTLIGAALVLGAVVIAKAIGGTIDQLRA